jgi:septum site-determining protein MinC
VDADVLPQIRIRGRNFMALVVAPEAPFGEWFAALDQQMRNAAGFFAGRPVVADLTTVQADVGAEAVLIALDGLEARGLKVIGAEGVRAPVLAGTRWERLPTALHGRDAPQQLVADPPKTADAVADRAPPPRPSLLVEEPVRSGRSIVFEEGDVTVVGTVASGAEVLAGGSVHIYGALRGRAIAGLRTSGARIFCRKLEAELLGVDQLYRTAEHWGAGLHGRAVQVRCDRGALRLSAFE